ncbi:hypothetical protein IFM89_024061 [Coptis chinensis]|uniref:RsdA/BaiN/AoA(So)-like Rossmann fold-like domain-containing protein n=1 Tax=Coptis chinensis TaxID=261450 RepID=A0A835HUI2_9MAGN|nr:hypothetical protein IFM89_024061 [Coptis chinensis]
MSKEYTSLLLGTLLVDFLPDLHIEDVKSMLLQHKDQFVGIDGDTLWASIPKNSLISVSSLLEQCSFRITGKGQFKDEFVGVPLSKISLNTMESKIQPRLFFAGEVLNVDGITGGFNFQLSSWDLSISLLTSNPDDVTVFHNQFFVKYAT